MSSPATTDDSSAEARPRRLVTAHGALRLPAFLPDATRGVVRTLAPDDLAAAGVQALMVNCLHLARTPGTQTIARTGGLHAFMGWRGPLAADSGGFQALSMAGARVTDRGLSVPGAGAGAGRLHLTPERTVRRQLRLGADVAFCLDHCPRPDADYAAHRQSVRRTVRWAAACRAELRRAGDSGAAAPLLFAVVQGGPHRDLRAGCVEELAAIGFDGLGFGGWPIAGGRLDDMVYAVAELAPAGVPLHGLGIGSLGALRAAAAAGYRLFDCVLPTRDARHGRLYADDGRSVSIRDERFARRREPVVEGCDCAACRTFPAAYLHHLFRVGDGLGGRLASIHNLRVYSRAVGAAGAAPHVSAA